jgi:hypothetical protein
MSGPKVVRIVTREEIIEVCEGMLSQLRDAIAQWSRIGKRNDLVTEEELVATRKRLSDIEALLRADQFTVLQKQVPREIAYLKSDMARRLGAAAERSADARTRTRRLAETAAQLLVRLQGGEPSAQPALVKHLAAVVDGSIADVAQVEKILNDALSHVAGRGDDETPTEAQRELAARLGDGAPSQSLEAWLAAHRSTTDTTDCQIDRAIAELALDGAETEAEMFAQRQRAITAEASPQRRRMLADTLLLDLSNARAALRERERKLEALAEQAALLTPLGNEDAHRLEQDARTALASADIQAAERLLPAIEAFILTHRKALAAQARRKAVLGALAALGYEIREGMETAWASDGKLAVRRGANPEIGVEITSTTESERMQFRPVRFASEVSSGTDRDIDILWCADFDVMQGRLASASCSLVVERATPPGEVPVKIITNVVDPGRRVTAQPHPIARSLQDRPG